MGKNCQNQTLCLWSRIKLLDRMVGQCSFWPHFEWKNIHYRPTIKLPNQSFPFFLTFTFSTKMKSKFLSCLENIVPDSSKNVAQFVVIVLRWISQKNIKEKGHFPYFGLGIMHPKRSPSISTLCTLESLIVGYGRLVFSRFFFPLKPSQLAYLFILQKVF